MESHEKLGKLLATSAGSDATESVDALMKVVDAEKPPVRLLLGNQAVDVLHGMYDRRLAHFKEWEDVSRSAG